MGGSSVKAEGEQVHPRLGPVRFGEGERGLQMTGRFVVSSQADYAQWSAELHRYQGNESLLVPLSHKCQEAGLCGMAVTAACTFESFPFSLDREICNRSLTADFFKEPDVWYVLFVLLEACVDYEREPSSTKHFDIRPKNILINGLGHIKLLCKGSFPGFKNGLLTSYEQRETAYLSPQQSEALDKHNISPALNYSLCEVFSIGATLLQLCSLQPCEAAFQTKDRHHTNVQLLMGRWVSLQQSGRYSKMLVQLLRAMIVVESRSRMSAGQIWNMFLPYEESIFRLEPFNFKREASAEALRVYYSKIAEIPGMAQYIKDKPFRKPFFNQDSSLSMARSLSLPGPY